jgi:hypothetical protein
MNKLANFDSEDAACFQERPSSRLLFSRFLWLPCRSVPGPSAKCLVRAPLDGERPPSHGAAMTIIRNRFFGICREIISA